jgi:hypothetical protein
MAEQAGPASMESLGLDSRSLADCEIYDAYLMSEEEHAIEREIAEEDAALAAQDIADQVVLDATDSASDAPPSDAVAEARRTADAYLAEHLPPGWGRTTLVACPVVRARKREPLTRRTRRRLRVRSGSRGDPPDGDDPDSEPPLVRGRAARGRPGVEAA